MFGWLRRRRDQYVSTAWLREHDCHEARAGWVGPRWRFRTERMELTRIARLEAIASARIRHFKAKGA